MGLPPCAAPVPPATARMGCSIENFARVPVRPAAGVFGWPGWLRHSWSGLAWLAGLAGLNLERLDGRNSHTLEAWRDLRIRN